MYGGETGLKALEVYKKREGVGTGLREEVV